MNKHQTSLADLHRYLQKNEDEVIEGESKYLNAVTQTFNNYFAQKKYANEPAVRICEKLDPTVRFIGAPISVLKPYFMENRIPKSGIYMSQNCVRTRNFKHLLETTSTPKYGSFFTGMCVLIPYEQLNKLCAETIDFLKNEFGLVDSEIHININNKDKDLVEAVKGLLPKDCYKINTMPQTYYRHKYGIENVWGRNFNIAIMHVKTGLFEDIGNIIVIESDQGQLGVELAIGDTTILQLLLGFDHILDCYSIGATGLCKEVSIQRKMEDAIITTLALAREGLKPSSNSTQSRILRRYIKALGLYRRISSISIDELESLLENTERGCLPFAYKRAWEKVVTWVEEFEAYADTINNAEDALIQKILVGYGTKENSHVE